MKVYIMVALWATGMLFACQQHKGKIPSSSEDLVLHEPVSNESMGWIGEAKSEEETRIPQQFPVPQPKPVPADYRKQIIRNATISFGVKNAQSVHAAVIEVVKSGGGYIASATEVQLAGEVKHEMIIRVPREKFDELVSKITGYADTLLQKNITSEDVTAEYIDTRARITAKEKVKDRYYEFLKQAKNIDEVLKVQSEITDLQEEIEAATGRVNYIQYQAALSSISLSVVQALPVTVIQPKAPGFWREVVMACAEGWEMVRILLVGLVKLWPVWLVGITVWMLYERKKMILRISKKAA